MGQIEAARCPRAAPAGPKGKVPLEPVMGRPQRNLLTVFFSVLLVLGLMSLGRGRALGKAVGGDNTVVVWYKRPEVVASFVIVLSIACNLIFW